MNETQNFENHAKLVPAFHFFVLPVFLINVGSGRSTAVLHAFSAAIGSFAGSGDRPFNDDGCSQGPRIFAAHAVQDRVIRLEMRAYRTAATVLPADLLSADPRIHGEPASGVALCERCGALPELSRKVLEDKLADRKAIKKMIRDWQPDFLARVERGLGPRWRR